MAVMKPTERSCGVDGVLVIHVLPLTASASVTSVKVPPTSMASVHDGMSMLLRHAAVGEGQGRYGSCTTYQMPGSCKPKPGGSRYPPSRAVPWGTDSRAGSPLSQL